ncbi:hypothetical protein, partial [Terribacillus sp. AE2B 122]
VDTDVRCNLFFLLVVSIGYLDTNKKLLRYHHPDRPSAW